MTFILSIPIEARLALLFVIGCCAGGLVNWAIYRLAYNPRPITPWAAAPRKAPPRRAWDRLPVIGWLGLRRESKLHGAAFWLRPMILELLCGAVFAGLYGWEVQACTLVPQNLVPPQYSLGSHPGEFMTLRARHVEIATGLAVVRHEQFLAHIVLFCFMLAAFWIDVDEMMIPDAITIPGTLLGLVIVSCLPYSLLPQANDIPNSSIAINNGATHLPMATSVWLTSPDQLPLRLGQRAEQAQYVQPWDVPTVTGRSALAAAIAGFCAWCLALAPGYWSTRHGYAKAIRVYTARMVRERNTYVLLAVAVVGSGAIAWVWSRGGPHWAGLASGLAGLAVGGMLVWLVRIFGSVALGVEAMGFGDVTLLAMIGAFLGWQAAVVVFFIAPLIGAVIGIGLLLLRGEKMIPFGPFLCLAAAVAVVFWPSIWRRLDAYFALGWILIAMLMGFLMLIVVLLPPVRWLTTRMQRKRS